MTRTLRNLMTWLVVLGLFAPACRCAGGSDKGATPPEGEKGTNDPGTAAAASNVDKDWKEGNLPSSLMEGEPKQGGEVRIQLYTEPPSLNTVVDSDWWAARLTQHRIYEALVGIDAYDHPRYQHVPELAERWEISDDHLVYTFYLRKGVKWHDGQPFSAKDVIATFDKVRDETTKAAHMRSYIEELESYRAIDDHTVEFKWKRPYFLALEDPFYSFPIYPAHIIASLSGSQFNEAATNPLNRHPIGTGPWKFVEWESNQKIVFERNDDYWGKKAHLDRLVFRIVKDDDIALQLAERGELDMLTRVQAEPWSRMEENATFTKNFYRSKYFDSNYMWIGWNQKRPYFQDKRVRKALAQLIDRPKMAEKFFYGLYRPTDCHFYWAGPICKYEHGPLPYDPMAAAKLLDEAGWKDTDGDGIRDKGGVKFSFTFMIPASSKDAPKLGTKMKEDFARAGIELNLQRVEWSAFTKRLREREFDSCTLLWGSTTPRGDPTQIWHARSIDGGSNYVGFKSDRADAIMEEARNIFDDEIRQNKYRELQQILWDEQPYTFLYVRPRLSLVHKKLRGVADTLLFWQFRDFWLEDGGADRS